MLQGNGGHHTLTSGLLDMGTKCTSCTVGGGGGGHEKNISWVFL